MDPVTERNEPDEARPAKRVRLDAPLDITEEVQEEVHDDSDWADVYDNTDTPARVPSPARPEQIPGLEQEKPAEMQSGHHENGTIHGAPPEAIDSGDELVARRNMVSGINEPSEDVLEETSKVEVGTPKQDEEEESKYFYEDTPVKGDSTRGQTQDAQAATSKQISEQDGEFLAAAAAQKQDQNAEWQFDSSDAEASSDSDSDSSSDDSSDDSDSGSEGGYEMLDLATAAKILMSGEGDDDGEGKNKTGDRQPRTANEVKDAIVPKPDVVVTEDMNITYLGTIERTVESLALIKAVTPGEYQVLESGSVLCNEAREVIGAVAETFGRVQEPMYSVAFTNAKEIEDMGLSHGTKVYYVDNHSTFVFTQPLKNLKGTDASNIHDEEVGEDEMEFSDDEKEAEYKRMKKLAKRGGRGGLSRTAFSDNRASSTIGNRYGPDGSHTFVNGSDVPQQQYGGGMNYDEEEVTDEFYNPLKRPDNLSQLMAGGPPPPMPQRGNFGNRGRGDRGRGRGDGGRGRGGFDRNQRAGKAGNFTDNPNRDGIGQQSGHRGPAHSFPDRHNNRGGGNKHQYSRGESKASHSSSSPPQQAHRPYQNQPQHPPQYPPQPTSPQTYQFNGYTFQYGNPPPQPPAQQPAYHGQQQPNAQNPSSSIPAGAYVNPAFFQGQQGQNQWGQPQQMQQPIYGGWPAQQHQQYTQPGTAQQWQQQPPPQQTDLAAILRQLGGQQ